MYCRVGADKLPLQLEQTGLPPNVLNNFPRLGTVLRVMIDEKYEHFGNHFKIVRDWVRIRNLHCRTVSGLWEGVLTPQTKIRHLSRNDNSVVGHLRYLLLLLILRNVNQRCSRFFVFHMVEVALFAVIELHYIIPVGLVRQGL